MHSTWVCSLGGEDPLEKEMATHSSILAWRIPWTEEPGELHSHVEARVRHDLATKERERCYTEPLNNTPEVIAEMVGTKVTGISG